MQSLSRLFNQTEATYEATYVNSPFNIILFEHTLSTQEHAGVQVIILGNIYISQLNITKYIHRPVGMDPTRALIVDHLHLSASHSE